MRRVSSLIKKQLPEFVNNDYPLFGEFLTDYFKSLELDNRLYDVLPQFEKFSDSTWLYGWAETAILIDSLDNEDLTEEIRLETVKNIPKSGLIKIDQELIYYKKAIRTNNTWILSNCIRGYSFNELFTNISYNTEPNSHESGTNVEIVSYKFKEYFIKKLYESNIVNFVPYERLKKEFQDPSVLLFNYIKYLKAKGTEDSINFFFNCLFNRKDIVDALLFPTYNKNEIYFIVKNNKNLNLLKPYTIEINNNTYDITLNKPNTDIFNHYYEKKLYKWRIYSFELENGYNNDDILLDFSEFSYDEDEIENNSTVTLNLPNKSFDIIILPPLNWIPEEISIEPRVYYPGKQIARLSDSFHYQDNKIFFVLLDNKELKSREIYKININNYEFEGILDREDNYITDYYHNESIKSTVSAEIYSINLGFDQKKPLLAPKTTFFNRFEQKNGQNRLYVDSTLGFKNSGKLSIFTIKKGILRQFLPKIDQNKVIENQKYYFETIEVDYISKTLGYFVLDGDYSLLSYNYGTDFFHFVSETNNEQLYDGNSEIKIAILPTLSLNTRRKHLIDPQKGNISYNIGHLYRTRENYFIDLIYSLTPSPFKFHKLGVIPNEDTAIKSIYTNNKYYSLISSGYFEIFDDNNSPYEFTENRTDFIFSYPKYPTKKDIISPHNEKYVGMGVDGLLLKSVKSEFVEESGKILKIDILNGGSDYIVGNTLAFNIGGDVVYSVDKNGNNVFLINGKLLKVIVTNPGSGYGQYKSNSPNAVTYSITVPTTIELPYKLPELDIKVEGGKITSIAVLDPGYGFTEQVDIVFNTPSQGTQASAILFFVGEIIKVNEHLILNEYTTPPEIEVLNGKGADFDIVVNEFGEITNVNVINDGFGYLSEPYLQVESTKGTGAFLKARISKGRIRKVDVIAGGRGYEVSTTKVRAIPNGRDFFGKVQLQKWHYNDYILNNDSPFYQEPGGKIVRNHYVSGDLTKHSPIIGVASDGYPIYGNVGYSDPNNASSPLKVLQPSYQLTSVNRPITLPISSYPLGTFVEDYKYVRNLGDLDIHNGRYCVTPEFPGGTYAYFATINSSNVPKFPYIIGNSFKGYHVKQTLDEYDIDTYNSRRVLLNHKISNLPIINTSSTANRKLPGFNIINRGSNYRINDEIIIDDTLSGYISAISGKSIVVTGRNNRTGYIITNPNHGLKVNDRIYLKSNEINNIPIYFNVLTNDDQLIQLDLLDGKRQVGDNVLFYGRWKPTSEFFLPDDLRKIIVSVNGVIQRPFENYVFNNNGLLIKNSRISDDIFVYCLEKNSVFYFEHIGDNGNTYELNNSPNNNDLVLVTINGVIQSPESYTITGSSIEYAESLSEGDLSQVWFIPNTIPSNDNLTISQSHIEANYYILRNGNSNFLGQENNRTFLVFSNNILQSSDNYQITNLSGNKVGIKFNQNILLENIRIVTLESSFRYKELDLYYIHTIGNTTLQKGFKYYFLTNNLPASYRRLLAYDENNDQYIPETSGIMYSLDVRNFENKDISYYIQLGDIKEPLSLVDSYYSGYFDVKIATNNTIFFDFKKNRVPLYPLLISPINESYIVVSSKTAKGGVEKAVPYNVYFDTYNKLKINSDGSGAIITPILNEKLYDIQSVTSIPYISHSPSLSLTGELLYYIELNSPLSVTLNQLLQINGNIPVLVKDISYLNFNIIGIEIQTNTCILIGDTISSRTITKIYKQEIEFLPSFEFIADKKHIRQKEHTLSTGNSYLLSDHLYHPHSYVIQTENQWQTWGELFKSALHPLGYELTGQLTVDNILEINQENSIEVSLVMTPDIVGEMEIEYLVTLNQYPLSNRTIPLFDTLTLDDELHSKYETLYKTSDDNGYQCIPNFITKSYTSYRFVSQIKDNNNSNLPFFTKNSNIILAGNEFLDPNTDFLSTWNPVYSIVQSNQNSLSLSTQTFFNDYNLRKFRDDNPNSNFDKSNKFFDKFQFDIIKLSSPHYKYNTENYHEPTNIVLYNSVAQTIDKYEFKGSTLKLFHTGIITPEDDVSLFSFCGFEASNGKIVHPKHFKLVKIYDFNYLIIDYDGYAIVSNSNLDIIIFVDGILQRVDTYSVRNGIVTFINDIPEDSELVGIYFQLPIKILTADRVSSNIYAISNNNNFYNVKKAQTILVANEIIQHKNRYTILSKNEPFITIQVDEDLIEDYYLIEFPVNVKSLKLNQISSNKIDETKFLLRFRMVYETELGCPRIEEVNENFQYLPYINGVFQLKTSLISLILGYDTNDDVDYEEEIPLLYDRYINELYTRNLDIIYKFKGNVLYEDIESMLRSEKITVLKLNSNYTPQTFTFNGVTTTFNLSYNLPIIVNMNGVQVLNVENSPYHYTVANQQITFTVPPLSSDKCEIYFYDTNYDITKQLQVSKISSNLYQLRYNNNNYFFNTQYSLYINNILQSPSSYIINGSTISFRGEFNHLKDTLIVREHEVTVLEPLLLDSYRTKFPLSENGIAISNTMMDLDRNDIIIGKNSEIIPYWNYKLNDCSGYYFIEFNYAPPPTDNIFPYYLGDWKAFDDGIMGGHATNSCIYRGNNLFESRFNLLENHHYLRDTVNHYLVSKNNIIQIPEIDYTIYGNIIKFYDECQSTDKVEIRSYQGDKNVDTIYYEILDTVRINDLARKDYLKFKEVDQVVSLNHCKLISNYFNGEDIINFVIDHPVRIYSSDIYFNYLNRVLYNISNVDLQYIKINCNTFDTGEDNPDDDGQLLSYFDSEIPSLFFFNIYIETLIIALSSLWIVETLIITLYSLWMSELEPGVLINILYSDADYGVIHTQGVNQDGDPGVIQTQNNYTIVILEGIGDLYTQGDSNIIPEVDLYSQATLNVFPIVVN